MASLAGGAAPPASACVAPETPTNFKASPGKRRISLTWDAVSGAAGYKLYQAQGGKYTLVATVAGTSYTQTGLSAGTTYTYALTAYRLCEDGRVLESPYSGQVSAVPSK